MTTDEQHQTFLSWLDSPLGRRLLQQQEEHLEAAARRFHGDAMLWCGPQTKSRQVTARSMVRLRMYCPHSSDAGNDAGKVDTAATDVADISVGGDDEHAWLRADPHALPLRSRSVSAVVLHHTLDLVEEPRHALREVVRVLEYGGLLVVCGFNPYSLWGLRRLYAAVRPDPLSELNFVAPNRLHDWLTVLGMHAPRLAPTLMKRPVNASVFDSERLSSLRERLQRLPLGGCYVMTAVKEAGSGRVRWREELTRRLASGVSAPKPVVRQLQPSVQTSQSSADLDKDC